MKAKLAPQLLPPQKMAAVSPVRYKHLGVTVQMSEIYKSCERDLHASSNGNHRVRVRHPPLRRRLLLPGNISLRTDGFHVQLSLLGRVSRSGVGSSVCLL